MFSFGKTSHEESWFGPRQLVQTGPEPTQANDARRLGRLQGGVSDDLVRLSIGIEEVLTLGFQHWICFWNHYVSPLSGALLLPLVISQPLRVAGA